jgi:hypothetical protein
MTDQQDYQKAQQEIIDKRTAEELAVFDTCNASLRCGIACPIWDRTAEHCEFCGNQDCIDAKRALDEMWAKLP